MLSSKRHIGIVFVLASLCGVSLRTTARGGEFAGGTGEPNDPYQIATAGHLTAIRSSDDPNLFTRHFVLTASIDLAGRVWSDPVIPLLSGSFDGQGYVIRNLRMQAGKTKHGLFGTVLPGGEVKNLGVVDLYMKGDMPTGALVCSNLGRVFNCYTTGTVIGGFNVTGGLVATNYWQGTVINSYSTTAVTGTTDVGGLIGTNDGEVSACYASGNVTGDSDVGGLVGDNWNTGRISSCHSTGEVNGNDYVGGLVGGNLGRMDSSYSTAMVTGLLSWVGGLAGSNGGEIASCYANATVLGYESDVGGLAGHNFGVIESCYSTGSVTGAEHVGGLVGRHTSDGAVITSYSIAQVTDAGGSSYIGGLFGRGDAPDNCYFLAPPEGSGPDNGIGTSLTSKEMKQQASFVGWDFWGIDEGTPTDQWFMPQDAYPVLAWQTEITGLHAIPYVVGLPPAEAEAALTAAGFVPGEILYDFDSAVPVGCVIRADPYGAAILGTAVDLIVSDGRTCDWAANAGDGTSANPYQIETAGQLESLGGHPELWDKCFVLTADLDMIGRMYSMALIAPDVNDLESGFQGVSFAGSFDGRGHIIRNLTIRHTDATHDFVGLFGLVAEEGRITDLHLLRADVEGGTGRSSAVGILAGFNAGTISSCSASGLIDGGKGDGLVGVNTGALTNCTADVTRL